MAKWVFEPGHTAAEFRARHMMVCWVRGHVKDVHGSLDFDPDRSALSAIEATLQAEKLWSGETQRDEHLRSGDFLDVSKHATITFKSTKADQVGASEFKVIGDLTIRGVTRSVPLALRYLGKWRTSYWTDKGDAGPITRVGFTGKASIDRYDFGVNWNGQLENQGLVVGEEVLITVDVEALLESELTAGLKRVEQAKK